MLFGNFTVCKDEDTGRIYYDYDKVFTGEYLALSQLELKNAVAGFFDRSESSESR